MGKKLNFGCGKNIKSKEEGWVNVDIQKDKRIDKSFDFNKFPYPFKKNSFDYILIDNVLEHLDDINAVMKEIWRIARPNSKILIRVPYYNSFYAYGDYTHKHYFNEHSFEVICETKYRYNKTKRFEIIYLKLIPQRFIKWIPFPILKIMSRVLNNIFIEIEVKMRVLK